MPNSATDQFLTAFLPTNGGNGSVDCTTAMQDAMNAAANGGNGGKVTLPAGDYVINGTIIWPASGGICRNITLEGAGSAQGAGASTGVGAILGGATVLRKTSGSNAMFDCSAGGTGGGVTPFFAGAVRDIAFNRTGGTGSAMVFNGMFGARIQRISLYGWGLNAVVVHGECFYNTELEKVILNNSQWHFMSRINGATLAGWQTTRNTFAEAALRCSGSKAGFADTGSGPIISGGTYDDNAGPSIEVVRCTGVVFRDIYNEKPNSGSTDGSCFLVTPWSAGASFHTNILVEGCYMRTANDGIGGATSGTAMLTIAGTGAIASIKNSRIARDSSGNAYFTRWTSGTANCEAVYEGLSAASSSGMATVKLSTTTPPSGFVREAVPAAIGTT